MLLAQFFLSHSRSSGHHISETALPCGTIQLWFALSFLFAGVYVMPFLKRKILRYYDTAIYAFFLKVRINSLFGKELLKSVV
jgi:hypothetical protein